MSHNMSIYRRLNPRLLVQAGLGLGLLHWANMSNIYISNRKKDNKNKNEKPQKNFRELGNGEISEHETNISSNM